MPAKFLEQFPPAHVVTYSGKIINLKKPDPESFCIEDIAHSLSGLRRCVNHTSWPSTVGEHSLLCDHLAPPGYKLAALVHDFSEYITVDIPSPVKDMFPKIRKFEKELLKKIIKGLELPEDTFKKVKQIKSIDNLAFEIEANICHPQGLGRYSKMQAFEYKKYANFFGTKSEEEVKNLIIERFHALTGK